jgi:hypothetical protein
MLSHRIIGASAVLLAVTIGSAAAQEETSAGKPLQLLQFARHQASHQAKHEPKAPLRPHARAAEKPVQHAEAKRHIAKAIVAKHHTMFAAIRHHRVAAAAPPPAPEAAQPAPAAPQAAIWPPVNSAVPGSTAVPAAPAAAQNVKTEPVVSDAPNAIASDGKMAQAAPAPELNTSELAADAHPAAAEPAPVGSAASEPAVRAMIATPAPADSGAKNPIGSAPWLLQVLAAFGGALGAGAVAWFFILRRRGEPKYEDFFAETLAPGE